MKNQITAPQLTNHPLSQAFSRPETAFLYDLPAAISGLLLTCKYHGWVYDRKSIYDNVKQLLSLSLEELNKIQQQMMDIVEERRNAEHKNQMIRNLIEQSLKYNVSIPKHDGN